MVKTAGRTLNVFAEQTLGDVAEVNISKECDPNEAALDYELLLERKLEVEKGKAAVAAEQARHAAFVKARFDAYVKTPEGKVWLARVTARQNYRGHRKQTHRQQIANQMR